MTIAPCFAAVNAAHDPRPANGFSGMPSTVTFTSARGQPMRTTPSAVVVALAPAALPIASASSFVPFGPSALTGHPATTAAPPTTSTRPKPYSPLTFLDALIAIFLLYERAAIGLRPGNHT